MNTTAAPDLRTQLFAAQEWYADLVANVADEQRSLPTPCDEFDVRALMTHMSVVMDKVIGLAELHRDPFADHVQDPNDHARILEEQAQQRVDGQTGQALSATARDQLSRARQAWTDQVLDEQIQLGWGPVLPGRIVAGIYLMEILSHGWDLATATGQPSEAPSGLGEAGLAAAQASLPPEMPRGVQFKDPVEPAPNAGPTEQMVNWTGRSSR